MVYESVLDYPVYEGRDLGLTYSPQGSTFKVWSPEASAVKLNLYGTGLGGTLEASYEMTLDQAGVWTKSISGDHAGTYYTFQIHANGEWLAETPGPYAKAVGVNGQRAFVLDLNRTNPEGWGADVRPPLNRFNDIVIYEMHIRDMSISPTSGIQSKGKYLGLTEEGTRSPEGLSTGIDHLKELGVTHVHILPMFDFRSIDETKLGDQQFNWGYEPQNFNVPEGSYATDPYQPERRINEMKQMILALHQHGIRVIMDVVYNHVGFGEPSSDNFSLTAPGYYYRTNEDGSLSNASACGNETASERPMMRKYIIESVDYWVNEYHIDGFRFDLMGIHDVKTMNMVSAHVQNIDPTIFVYGEGWKAGSSPLADQDLALKSNVPRLKNVAAFSDEIRDGLKGSWHDWKAPGFVSGNRDRIEGVKFGIAGGVQHPQVAYERVAESDAPWALKPDQCIVYVSCHDNHTLYDKLKIVSPEASEEVILKQHVLANTIVLTSQGVPFLHAGVEFARTKQGVENSYQSPDSINALDWTRKSQFPEVVDHYKALIKMRKEHPVFTMDTQEKIAKHLKFLPESGNMIVYELDGTPVNDRWKKVMLVFNGEDADRTMKLDGTWNLRFHGTSWTEAQVHNEVEVSPYSALLLWR